MSEDKTNSPAEDKEKKEAAAEDQEKVTARDEAEAAPTRQAEDPEEELQDQPKKDDLGLEELPEDIKKKLEKKKAEKTQKVSKKGKQRKKKKKEKTTVTSGKAFIRATYNNTIVTLTDMQGNVISWASAGVAGFKGPKKSTPYAASIITRLAVGKAREDFGLSEVMVFVKGVGTGRESAIRSLNSNGLMVTNIKDITPIPHNGCRPPKPRRV